MQSEKRYCSEVVRTVRGVGSCTKYGCGLVLQNVVLADIEVTAKSVQIPY